jgi:hypothetical protein
MSGDSILVRQFSLVAMAIMLLLQSACATRQPDVAKPDNLMPDMSKSLNNPGWWRVQFVKHWPEGSPAPFSYDLLLAERVIQPVLKLAGTGFISGDFTGGQAGMPLAASSVSYFIQMRTMQD